MTIKEEFIHALLDHEHLGSVLAAAGFSIFFPNDTNEYVEIQRGDNCYRISAATPRADTRHTEACCGGKHV